MSCEYRLHSIQSEHTKTITAIAWCPHDVDVIVSAGADFAVIIWDVAEQQVLAKVTLREGAAVPCSIAWGIPKPSGIAFIGKRGPLMTWFSTDECDAHRVTASHSEIRGFSSDVCQMRCHPRQRDKVALGHVDGSISIFVAGKQHIFNSDIGLHLTTTLQQLQPFNGLFSRTTWVSRYQKGKTNLDFTGARDSEW